MLYKWQFRMAIRLHAAQSDYMHAFIWDGMPLSSRCIRASVLREVANRAIAFCPPPLVLLLNE